MEGPARAWEPFHITLQNGVPVRLEATNGYRLQVNYVSLKSHTPKSAASLLWKPVVGTRDYFPLARLTETRPTSSVGFAFQPPLSDPTRAVEFLSKGAAVTLFASWKLYNDIALESDYLSSASDEELPVLEDPKRKCTWTMNEAFGNPAESSRLSKRKKKKNQQEPDGTATDVAPPLVAAQPVPSSAPKVEKEGEPAARTSMSITPPRFLTLVSSSPERSASRSEDESVQEYKIRIPSAPANAVTAPRPVQQASRGSTVSAAVAGAFATVAVASGMGRVALRRENVTVSEPAAASGSRKRKASPASPRHAPAGVLKSRSKKRADGKPFTFTSPRLAPDANAAVDGKKKVKWNPRSPDVRFISPPLAAIHRAFPGGLLDIGVPLLERTNIASTGRPVNVSVSGTSSPASRLSLPAVNTHQPHLPPKITPPSMRPTVIE